LVKGGSAASGIEGGNTKFQVPNPKQIEMTKGQNSNRFEHQEFEFVACLGFGA
jgi:hypothetical protein